MRPEDVLTRSPTAEVVAAATEALPRPDMATEEALRRLLESFSREPVAAEWPTVLKAPREKMDTRYAEPATSHRRFLGPVLVLTKRAFRLAFQPFINEVLRRQVEFNEALLESLASLYEQQQESARTAVLWRREVEQRLRQLEQQAAAQARDGQAQPENTGRTGAS